MDLLDQRPVPGVVIVRNKFFTSRDPQAVDPEPSRWNNSVRTIARELASFPAPTRTGGHKKSVNENRKNTTPRETPNV